MDTRQAKPEPAAAMHAISSEISEKEAVRAARDDPSAFAPLYALYHPRVYRYLRLRTARDDEAADLTQRVFLRALDALPRYEERGLPFAAWLFRIARNIATDAHRSRRTTIKWGLPPEAPYGTSDDDPKEATIRIERAARLHTLLHELNAEQREILGRRFAAGLSSREIAPIVGRSEAAAKKQLTKLIQHLKERYGEP